MSEILINGYLAEIDRIPFADHKERVLELVGRVARVSVETMAIVGAMAAVRRD